MFPLIPCILVACYPALIIELFRSQAPIITSLRSYPEFLYSEELDKTVSTGLSARAFRTGLEFQSDVQCIAGSNQTILETTSNYVGRRGKAYIMKIIFN
jgi:hypothetical protein